MSGFSCGQGIHCDRNTIHLTLPFGCDFEQRTQYVAPGCVSGHPFVDLMLKSVDRLPLADWDSINGQPTPLFPANNRPDIPTDVRSDLFPGIQSITVLRTCRHDLTLRQRRNAPG